MFWRQGYKIMGGMLVFGLLLAAGLLPAYGDQLEDFKKQQQKLQQQMEQQEKKIKEKEAEKKTYIGQLNQLEKEMTEVEEDINSLARQLENAEYQVALASYDLAEKEAELNQRLEVFKQRVKEVYINGQVSYLEVAFQATSVSDFLSRFDMLEELVEQDVELLNEIEAQINEVEEKKAALEKQRNRIKEIKDASENQKRLLAKKQQEKKQWIEKVEQDKKEVEKYLDELERLSAQIAAQIKKIQQERAKNSKNQFNGVFSWPTPGYTSITSEYGYRIHPILKTKRMHTGIDIGAPAGTSIKAVADGTVIFAGWLGAYGNATVIDHGGGISSMYAHQSSILVKENQDVKKGDVIGKVGSTGWSTGPHLHFEVRKDGDPINPWNYLK
ncbi:MAG: murein hydrolase activator EnvC family protein [Bacillota bacterium]|nr:peptidoglycan DD-metalloendopeptidase family protein [Clostridia bacterium]